MKIVVIDDDKLVALSLKTILESKGITDWKFRLLNADDTGARVYIE